MKSCLIGYTGFVGGNLLRQHTFDVLVNSKNVDSIRGESFDLVVCAGVSAVKWKANKDPEGDWNGIRRLLDVLGTVSAEQFILVSTIDVYPVNEAVDEDYDCHKLPNHAYGTNRLKVEDFCVSHFPNTLVVRLPGLFGIGLKKNVIFDLLHDNCLDMINLDSSFQYYCLENLWNDIRLCIDSDVKLANFFTAPIKTYEIVERFFPEKRIIKTERTVPVARYDFHTKYAVLRGLNGPYFYDKAEVMSELLTFIKAEQGK